MSIDTPIDNQELSWVHIRAIIG